MNERCVLFFGDSFVAGAGDEDGLGWVGRVAAAAWGEGLPLTAYNLGVRGETSEEVARRLAAEAAPRLIPDADNRLVIAVGANDVDADPGERPLSEQESLNALGSMLDGIERLGGSAYVIGPGPARDTGHDEASRSLSRAFGSLCKRRGVPYLDLLDELLADPAWNAGAEARDGIHSDAAGYAAYARLVVERGFLDWLRER